MGPWTPERLAIAALKYFKDKEAKEESWRDKLSHNFENSLSQKQNKKQKQLTFPKEKHSKRKNELLSQRFVDNR